MADSKSKFEALLKRLAAPARAVAWEDPPELAAGLLVDGSYRIVKLLGRGGMGEVYEAEQLSVLAGRHVALKFLRPGLAEDLASRERFEAEARTAGRLGHPNIVEVLATGALPDGRPYLCMELLEGQTLQAVLDRNGHIEEAHLLAIASALCGALGAAHAAGVVHRDLKPENVFLSTFGAGPEQVKLTDFGVAKLLHPLETRLTTTGVAVGTPHFMAPEQIRGDREIDHRADIYGLGALLYYCASGQFPFRGRTFAELSVQICTQVPAPPVGVTADFAAIIDIAMQKNPARRFVSALAFRAALAEVRG